MRIEQLREFVMFSQTLNVSETARKLDMTQSNLSRHILELEKELKISLVNHGSRMSLTPAGQIFMRDTLNILKQFDETVARCKQAQAEQSTIIRMQETGFLSDGTRKIYATVRDYRRLYPNTSINMKTLVRQTPIEALEGGRYDIVLLFKTGDALGFEEGGNEHGVRFVRVGSEKLSVWMDRENPLASRESLTLDDLSGVPIFSNTGVHYNFMDGVISELFSKYEIPLRFHTVTSTGSQKEALLIRDFHGSVLIVHRGTEGDSMMASREDMVFLPIEDPRAVTTMFLVAKEDNGRAGVHEFLDFAASRFEQDKCMV